MRAGTPYPSLLFWPTPPKSKSAWKSPGISTNAPKKSALAEKPSKKHQPYGWCFLLHRYLFRTNRRLQEYRPTAPESPVICGPGRAAVAEQEHKDQARDEAPDVRPVCHAPALLSREKDAHDLDQYPETYHE